MLQSASNYMFLSSQPRKAEREFFVNEYELAVRPGLLDPEEVKRSDNYVSRQLWPINGML